MAPVAEPWLAFVEVLVLFLGITGCILLKVDDAQPKPYMDEIFHVPQVQKYCHGNFTEWDPMITTLPGLYLLSVGVLHPLQVITQISITTVCGTFWLRCVNVVFAAFNLYIFYCIIRKLHGDQQGYSPWRALMTAATLATFPLLYFFSFFYYTDSGSTFFILLTYLLSLHGNHIMAASMGTMAVMFRQTNIVWVAFVAGNSISSHIYKFVPLSKKDLQGSVLETFEFFTHFFKLFLQRIKRNKQSIITLILDIISSGLPYIMVGAGFVAFILINGSIVVGAKDDHQAGFHIPQLFYFVSFTAAFAFIHFLSKDNIRGFFRALIGYPFIFGLTLILFYYLIQEYTFAHRYLLADNRHYTFYVWSRIFQCHTYVKYCLIPVYLFAIWGVFYLLKSKDIIWKLMFAACVIANLVPSMLLEFRYFIIPYLVFRLNIPVASWTKLIIELLLYTAVNAFTLYMFIEKPFKWENSDNWQRFMW